MEKLRNYNLVTLTPMFIILFLYIYEVMGTIPFCLVMFIYTFIYRPIFDKKRLIKLGLYENEGYWKMFWISRFKHYGPLILGTK